MTLKQGLRLIAVAIAVLGVLAAGAFYRGVWQPASPVDTPPPAHEPITPAWSSWYCQVNLIPLCFDEKSMRAMPTSQRLRWRVDYWSPRKISQLGNTLVYARCSRRRLGFVRCA